jgi:opacity protein-like surface antigen
MGKRALLAGAVLTLCFAAIAIAADITGNWAGSISVGDNQYNLIYSFKQDGEKLSGAVARDGGEPLPINDGKVQGDKVTFFVQADRGGTLTKYTMEGAIKGDEITLTTKTDGGPDISPMTLKRVK